MSWSTSFGWGLGGVWVVFRAALTWRSLAAVETVGTHSSTRWTRPDFTSSRVYHWDRRSRGHDLRLVTQQRDSLEVTHDPVLKERTKTPLAVTDLVDVLLSDDIFKRNAEPETGSNGRHRSLCHTVQHSSLCHTGNTTKRLNLIHCKNVKS